MHMATETIDDSSLDTQTCAKIKDALLKERPTRSLHETAVEVETPNNFLPETASTESNTALVACVPDLVASSRCDTAQYQDGGIQTASPALATRSSVDCCKSSGLRTASSKEGGIEAGTAMEPVSRHKDAEEDRTQPMDTQVYHDYYERKAQSFKDPDQAGHGVHLLDADIHPSGKTYATGDTGHVNLVLDIEEVDNKQTDNFVEDESADELGADSNKPIITKTPLRSGWSLTTTPAGTAKKRDHRGKVILPEARLPTSDFTNAFRKDRNRGVMGLSQLFAQTQAPSSPMPPGPRSDPIFDRPSPGFPHITRSSPTAPSSSPMLLRRDKFRRTNTDPRDVYLSVKASQERREYTKDERAAASQSSSLPDTDDEDELMDASEESKAERRRLKSMIEDEVKEGFAGLTAPLQRRKIDRRRREIVKERMTRLVTPGFKVQEKEIVEISDEGPEINASDDEYDELSHSIISSDKTDAGAQKIMGSTPKTATKPATIKSSPSPRAFVRQHHDRRGWGVSVDTTNCSPDPHTVSQTRTVPRPSQTFVLDSQISPKPNRPLAFSSYNDHNCILQPISPTSNARCELNSKNAIAIFETSSIPLVPESCSSKHNSVLPKHSEPSPPSSPPPLELLESPRTRRRKARDGFTIENVQVASGSIKTNGRTTTNTSSPKNAEESSRSQRMVTITLEAKSPQPKVDSSMAPCNSEIASLQPRALCSAILCNEPKTRISSASLPTPTSKRGRSNSLVLTDFDSVDVYETAVTHNSQSSAKIENAQLTTCNNVVVAELLPIKKFKVINAEHASADQPMKAGDRKIQFLTVENSEYREFMSGSSVTSSPQNKQKQRGHRKMQKDLLQADNNLPSPSTPLTSRGNNSVFAVPVADEQQSVATPRPPASHGDGPLTISSSETKHILKTRSSNVTINNNQIPEKCTQVMDTLSTTENDGRVESRKTPQKGLKNTSLATKPSAETTRQQRTHPLQGSLEVSLETQGSSAEALVPRRVFARFSGLSFAFYPATCLGLVSPTSTAYTIRFDDGTVDSVEPSAVRSLDLRVGDPVKVDVDGMRKKIYAVRGFRDLINVTLLRENEVPMTDVRGYKTVVLEEKSSSRSSENDKFRCPKSISVPVESIYITAPMWPHFHSRTFDYIPSAGRSDKRLQTPIDPPTAPVTPSSRSRRNSSALIARQSTSNLVSLGNCNRGIFDNMVFAVTYTSSKEAEKLRVKQVILQNGGRILSQGFDDLFDLPKSPPTSPSKSPRRSANTNNAHSTISLSPSAANLGFAALITDTHSRRVKYMQALALNLPCLSGRWILDCAASQQVLPWDRYLLPAGESAVLGGAVRSRTFPAYTVDYAGAANARLSHMIDRRTRLLDGHSVVIVMGKGKAEEKRKAYLFLTYALGAERVMRVKDLPAARTLLEQDRVSGCSWVYVDDGKVEEAKELLGVERKSKKRKMASGVRGMAAGNLRQEEHFKVVGDEFVMQSLILGALLDDEGGK